MKIIKKALFGLSLIIFLTGCSVAVDNVSANTNSSSETNNSSGVDYESTSKDSSESTSSDSHSPSNSSGVDYESTSKDSSESTSSDSHSPNIDKTMKQLAADLSCSNLNAYLNIQSPAFEATLNCEIDDNKCVEKATINQIEYEEYKTELYGGVEYFIRETKLQEDSYYNSMHRDAPEKYSLDFISRKWLGLSIYEEINKKKDCLSFSNGKLVFSGLVSLKRNSGFFMDLDLESLSFEFDNDGRLSVIAFNGVEKGGSSSNKYLGTIVIDSYGVTSIESEFKKYYLFTDNAVYSKDKTQLIKCLAKPIEESFAILDSTISICSRAFSDCSSLQKIIIPDSVTSIGYAAFSGCSAKIIWKENPSIVIITDSAFENYDGTSITIPDSVTSIGAYAFNGCENLTSIIIPDSVTSIGDSAFARCSSLETVNIPDSVTEIGDYAFSDCSSLESITIPDSVTSIGDYAFNMCSSLESIVLPDSLTSIGDYAFRYCSSIESITIPDSVTSIGDYAFNYCRSLDNINLELSLIDDWFLLNLPKSFYGERLPNVHLISVLDKKEIDTIVVPNSVDVLKNDVFAGLSSIKHLTIPSSVKTVGIGSLCGLSSLESLTFSGLTEFPDIWHYGFEILFECASASHFDYRMPIPDSLKTVALSDGSIKFPGIRGCTSVNNVILPDSLTSIGNYAFYGCKSLESIVIPCSVKEIDEGVFSECESLSTIKYNGTINEWLNIKKTYDRDHGWNSGSFLFNNIECTDGVIDAFSDYAYIDELDGYALSRYVGDNGSCIIPDFIGDKPVVEISEYAFDSYDCQNLTSISIPNTIISIDCRGFGRLSSLVFNEFDNACYLGNSENPYLVLAKAKNNSITNCTINNNCRFVAPTAFMDCSSLETVNIPDSVTEIGDYAFSGCSALNDTFVKISSVENFLNVSGKSNLVGDVHILDSNDNIITNLVIPNNVVSIGDSAFARCSSLEAVSIPDSVTSIGDSAFEYCTSLTSIIIPDSVTSIGDSAFARCSSLETVNISDSVTEIGDYAFMECSSLETFNIPSSISIVPHGLLYYCSSIQSITIPNSVTSIGSYVFEGCENLTSIIIPDSVTFIGVDAFKNCNSLTFYEYDNAYYLGNSGKPFLALVKAKNNSITSCEINDACKLIASNAFEDCTLLTSINIPDSVVSIGDGAFSGCSSLENITIPESVTSIGAYAFDGCENLTSIIIPDSVTSIGSYVFNGCENLTSIIIPDSVTSIGRGAFRDCSSLISITIPESVTEIDMSTFSGCSSLENITIPESVTSIGQWAFRYCQSLESVIIPKSITSIDFAPFSGCPNLHSIVYLGTKDEWNSVEKKNGWATESLVTVIECTDGDVNI